MIYTCLTFNCAISLSKASFPNAMNCPVCQEPLVKLKTPSNISEEDQQLISKLPYIIAFPLKETLNQNDYEKRLRRLEYTFLNYLKFLALISVSEFFNADYKNKKIVDLFLSQLMDPSIGRWNAFIRECYAVLKNGNIQLQFPEFYEYYIQVENKDKKHKISEEVIVDFGEINYSKKEGISSIGMLINFRNKYLGHGTPLNDNQAKELWNKYYPIFQDLLTKLTLSSSASLYKKENETVWKLTSDVITDEKEFSATIDESRVWLSDNKNRNLSLVPFLIIPSVFGDIANESQLYVFESYTGKTIKFFSPESIVKETSGEILKRLRLLLTEKQKEIPFTPANFTKDEFNKRIHEENQHVLDVLIQEKKVLPGIYQKREAIEIKLREWIGARSSVFFITAEAGSGKTNLLVEIQKQYLTQNLSSPIIRAARMQKENLKLEIASLLNLDPQIELNEYKTIAGTQASPTIFLIDGLNEANNAENIWREVLEICTLFDAGSVKFVVSNRASSKDELERYVLAENEELLMYGDKAEKENGVKAFTFWLTPLDMNEMKAAWSNYVQKEAGKYKPQFTFDRLATYDRALYNLINNPLTLRLFLEVYNGKPLPSKKTKHLNIWKDWFTKFDEKEQAFLVGLTEEVWKVGRNELPFDDAIKSETLKAYFENDIAKFTYQKLEKAGWISIYSKGLDGYIAFTVEGLLLYLLGVKLDRQIPKVNIDFINNIGDKGTKLQKSAVRSYLKELAGKGDLELIAALIDEGNDLIDFCVEPLLIYLKSFGVQTTIDKVLAKPTENDWKALLKLDRRLDDLQLHVLRKEFLTTLMLFNPLNNKDEIWLGLKAITIFHKELAQHYLNKIEIAALQNDEDLLFQLGSLENKFGNYDKAFEYFEKSLAIYLKLYGEEHPSVATTFNGIGNILSSLSKYDQSMEYHQKCLAIYLKTYGNQHPSVAVSYSCIGGIWKKKGEYDKALDFYQKSLDIKLKTLVTEHPDVATSYSNFGRVWKNKGEYDKALDFYQKCLDIRLKTLGTEHPSVATLYNNIGLVWDNKGEYDKALDFYQKCLDIYIKTLGDEHPWVATLYNNIGLVWDNKGEYDKALDYYIQSAEIRKERMGLDNKATKESISNALRLAKELGKEEELPDWMNKIN